MILIWTIPLFPCGMTPPTLRLSSATIILYEYYKLFILRLLLVVVVLLESFVLLSLFLPLPLQLPHPLRFGKSSHLVSLHAPCCFAVSNDLRNRADHVRIWYS